MKKLVLAATVALGAGGAASLAMPAGLTGACGAVAPAFEDTALDNRCQIRCGWQLRHCCD